jgi:hypothetical protein
MGRASKKTLGHKTRKDMQFKFYKTMALPCLTHGSETSTLKRTYEKQLEAA